MLCGTRYGGTSGQEAERHPGRRRLASASGAPRSSIAGGGVSELPTRLGLGSNNSANSGCRAGVGAYFAGDVGGSSRGTHASDPYAFPDTSANALIQCRGSRSGTGPAHAQRPLPEGIPGEARRSLLRLIGAVRWAETRVKLTSPTAAVPATAFARLAVRAEVALAGRGPECTAQKAAGMAPGDTSSSSYGSRGDLVRHWEPERFGLFEADRVIMRPLAAR